MFTFKLIIDLQKLTKEIEMVLKWRLVKLILFSFDNEVFAFDLYMVPNLLFPATLLSDVMYTTVSIASPKKIKLEKFIGSPCPGDKRRALLRSVWKVRATARFFVVREIL